jgi:moderate conductance mechanosensitive channel
MLTRYMRLWSGWRRAAAALALVLALLGSATAQEAAPAAADDMTASNYLAMRLDALRENLAALIAAAPTLPDEFERVRIILSLEFEENGLVHVGLLIVGFVVLGFGVEWLFHRFTSGLQKWIVALPLDTVAERLRAVGIRLAYGTAKVAAFTFGSVGMFVPFDWPFLLRDIVLGFLLAFLLYRVALVCGRFYFAPGGERFRIMPMSTAAAWFWHRRLSNLVGWHALTWFGLSMLRIVGVAPDARRIVAYACGLVFLALALEMIWRRPRRVGTAGMIAPWLGRPQRDWFVSAYLGWLWLLWAAEASAVFWLFLLAVAVPAGIRAMQRSVNHLLRPPGAAEAVVPSIYAVSLERGLRAALIIGGALVLAAAWRIDLVMLTASDTLFTRLLRGGLSAVVIVLVADFIWNVAKTLIDNALAGAARPEAVAGDRDQARDAARLRTLLPILRNMLLVVLVAMAGLMALSALGVEIGPLIAGAGVVGVAIGFGAQTLVKDIISGMFYLLDDAFRVGEYIQSGTYKGTVESFSLRSIKLRHHRGPLYTVPFGELGAIQNMSRDWVIDKMTIGVTYDSDLEKARKLVKEIGKELTTDPEFGHHIIEPLKMQGVEQFGDFAVQLRLKMTTKPGEQFVIRRKAYALIKKAFDANGIKFASPTVQVSGGDDTANAAARQVLELTKPPPPPAPA